MTDMWTHTNRDWLPSSDRWSEGNPHTASEILLVQYGKRPIEIPAGSLYFTDNNGRILIGWHGTYDPPLDMGGSSLIDGYDYNGKRIDT